MNFIHSEFISCDGVSECIVLNHKASKGIYSLFFYSQKIDLIKLSKKTTDINYEILDTFYTETRVINAVLIKDYLITLSEDLVIRFYRVEENGEKYTFELVNNIDLKNTDFNFINKHNDYAGVSITASDNKKILVLYSTNGFIILFDISEFDDPVIVYSKKLTDSSIVNVVFSNEDNNLNILINQNKETESKTLLMTVSLVKKNKFLEEVRELVACNLLAYEGISKSLYIVTPDSILEGDGEIASFSHPVRCLSKIYGDSFVFQTEDNNLFFFTGNTSIPVPSSPAFSKIWLLPNDIILTNLDEGEMMIFLFSKPTGARKKLPSFSHNPTKRIGHVCKGHLLACNENRVIVCDQMGIYQVTEHLFDERLLKTKSELPNLVQINANTVVSTGPEATDVIIGSADIKKDVETIDFLELNNSIYQVATSGIYLKGNIVATFNGSVILCSSCEEKLIVITDSYSVRIYSKTITNAVEYQYKIEQNEELTAVVVGKDFFALSSFNNDQNTQRSKIMLFDFSFNSIGNAIYIPSMVVTMFFIFNYTELYYSCINGCVYRAIFSENSTLTSISLVHCGSGPSILVNSKTSDEILLVDNDNSYIVREGRVCETNIKDTYSICFSNSDDNDKTLCYKKDGEYYTISFIKEGWKNIVKIEDIQKVVNLKLIGDFMIFVYLSEPNNGFFIRCNFNEDYTIHDEIKGVNPVFEVSYIGNNTIDILLSYENDNIYYLRYLLVTKEGIDTLSERQITFKVNKIQAMYKKFYVLAYDNNLHCVRVTDENEISFVKTSFELPDTISNFEIKDHLIWVTLSKGLILVLKFDINDYNFLPISKVQLTHLPSCCNIIDDLTCVFGSNAGYMTFVQIPKDKYYGKSYNANLDIILDVNILQSIVDIVVKGRLIIYLTQKGSIGSLLPINNTKSFLILEEVQQQHRKSSEESNDLTILNNKSLSSGSNIIQLSIFDLFESDVLEGPAEVARSTLSLLRRCFVF